MQNKDKLISSILIGLMGGTMILNAHEIRNLRQELYILNDNNNDITRRYNHLSEYVHQLEYDMQADNEILVDWNDLTIPSNLTSSDLNDLFTSNDTYVSMIGLEDSIIAVEREYGVNAIFITSLISEETGYNTSRRATDDNNIGGLGAYSPTSTGMIFDTQHDSIMYLGQLISNDYLDTNGKYYNGLSVESVNVRYCITEDQYSWSNKLRRIGNKYIDELNN